MDGARIGRNDWLNREADRLEAAMASMAVPIRVSGGRIEEGRMRYHATPVGGVRAQDMEELSPSVATAIGAESVAIRAERGEVTIDVSPAPFEPARLLPLLASLGALPNLVAVAGVDMQGVPVLLNLLKPRTWHLQVAAPCGSTRSAWLRGLAAGLALSNRPSDLQVLGVDLTGVELAFIEALPHALGDVAFRGDTAIDLLAWLRDEAERRRSLGRLTPHLVMVVDDLDALTRQTGKAAISLIKRLLSMGADSGVHVLWGCEASNPLQPLGGTCAMAYQRTAHGGPDGSGDFEIAAGGIISVVRPADLSARDLDRLVCQVRDGHGARNGDRRHP